MKSFSTALINKTDDPVIFRQKMLDWYDHNRRILPWRALPDVRPDPYHVWLSEVMLQQTTVQAVIPYFLKFIKTWPDVHALAQADSDDVMSAWAGLGYYARARNLQKCAKIVSKDFDGVFPDSQDTLKTLPGIGDYTSAAITSIAFDKPAVVVDGNVDRVMARYHALDIPFPDGKKIVKQLASYYSEGFTNRPGDYAQSLMDLGATLCTPKSPVCALCPIRETCQAYALGRSEDYPFKLPKKQRPHKFGYVYWVTNDRGDVLIHKRPEDGMLGGMNGLPTSSWCDDKGNMSHLNFDDLKPIKQTVHHVFTHFSLELFLFTGYLEDACFLSSEYQFFSAENLDFSSFPTLFKKSARLF